MTIWLSFRWSKWVNSSGSRASRSIGHESEWRGMKTNWPRAGLKTPKAAARVWADCKQE